MASEGAEVELISDDGVDPRRIHRVRDVLLERFAGDPPALTRDDIESCAGSSALVLSLLTDLLAELDQRQRSVPKVYDDADRVRDEHLAEAVGHLRQAVGQVSSWHGSLRRGRAR